MTTTETHTRTHKDFCTNFLQTYILTHILFTAPQTTLITAKQQIKRKENTPTTNKQTY